MPTADPRTHLIRPDFAEQALEGLVRAPAYRATRAYQAQEAIADVHDDAGHRISQLLPGEAYDAIDQHGGRLWGRCRRDGVVGWIEAAALVEGVAMPTHRVASVGGVLPFNALVDPDRQAVGDVALRPLGVFEDDPLLVAERLIGVPHGAGGRSDRVTDCAGLVQACLLACGGAGPRQADGQAKLGRAVTRDRVRRGDLVIWRHATGGPGWSGHAALMEDHDRLIHATGRHGAVVRETLAEADAHCRAEGFEAPVFRRL